jgi:hypothetical protein
MGQAIQTLRQILRHWQFTQASLGAAPRTR